MPDIVKLFQPSDAVNRNNFNLRLMDINKNGVQTDTHDNDQYRHLIPCTAAYDTATKRHMLTPAKTDIIFPDIFTARFLATTVFTAGDKVYIGNAEYVPSYTDGDTAVETGVWIVGAVVSLDCKKAGLKAYVGAGLRKELSQKATQADLNTTNAEVAAKEPTFGKNNAFNKNFGTSAGTVCQGNDSRIPATPPMPAGGGTFSGNAVAVNWNRADSCLRNIYVNGVSTNYILMVRK